MVSPNSSFGDIATTTINYYTPTIADNITDNIGLLSYVKKKGNTTTAPGGENILQPLEYAENGTFMWYSGYETLNITPSETLTAASFPWKQAAISVSISGLEGRVQNASGDTRKFDLLKSRIKTAEKTLLNNMSIGIYSDGTGTGGKQITGLQALVADTATSGTVGGISRSTYTFWRNVSFDATTDGGAAFAVTNIQDYMLRTYMQVIRNNEEPDVIVADNVLWRYYNESLTAIQRITNEADKGKGMFRKLAFMNADVICDGGQGGACPSSHMYFLNTDYIFYRPHEDTNVIQLGERESVNQDASVRLIVWAGNMTVSNSSMQAVLKD